MGYFFARAVGVPPAPGATTEKPWAFKGGDDGATIGSFVEAIVAKALRSLRRIVLAPDLAEVSFARRGFAPLPTGHAAARLQDVPRAVVCGFEWAMEASGTREAADRLELLDAEQRGFGYEGATMAFTITDVMGRGQRTRELLEGPGRPHILLAYIGIGFAMARLPRVLWKKVLPDLTGQPFHPVMSWLAVDGYGFDLAFFHTRRWVDEQRCRRVTPGRARPTIFPALSTRASAVPCGSSTAPGPSGWRRRSVPSPGTGGRICGAVRGSPPRSPVAVGRRSSTRCGAWRASMPRSWPRGRCSRSVPAISPGTCPGTRPSPRAR